jgi:hypothetical protein
MEQIDKLEMIIQGRRREKTAELKRCEGDGPYRDNPFFIQGLERELSTLSWIWTIIDAVKNNHHSVRDEMIRRMYG